MSRSAFACSKPHSGPKRFIRRSRCGSQTRAPNRQLADALPDIHDDELAWAAAEMFLATGDTAFEKKLISQFDPTDRETKRWTWWRLHEAYGCAIRSYAFGAKTGRIRADRLNSDFSSKCRSEILAAGQDQLRFAHESAYGTSFPDPTKRFRTTGWYFSTDRAFDLAVASQLDFPTGTTPRADFINAIICNMNYEGGCNPANVTYLTGLGWKRQRDIVHQYAQNDDRILPPSGIPIGNIQAGFQFLHHCGKLPDGRRVFALTNVVVTGLAGKAGPAKK